MELESWFLLPVKALADEIIFYLWWQVRKENEWCEEK